MPDSLSLSRRRPTIPAQALLKQAHEPSRHRRNPFGTTHRAALLRVILLVRQRIGLSFSLSLSSAADHSSDRRLRFFQRVTAALYWVSLLEIHVILCHFQFCSIGHTSVNAEVKRHSRKIIVAWEDTNRGGMLSLAAQLIRRPKKSWWTC
jgi:hypothetical protein